LLGKRVVKDIVEIGYRLTEAKRIARHGNLGSLALPADTPRGSGGSIAVLPTYSLSTG
jgi:hypothetical protein